MRNTKFVRTMLTIALVLTIIGSVTGGTIAWFTDAVVSNNNIVKSGKLDIDLQLKDYENDTWISLEKEENANVKVFDYGLWEPGFTQMETLKIVNKGNLAFEYILKVVPDGADKTTVNGVEKTLADAIDVYMTFGEFKPTADNGPATRDNFQAAKNAGVDTTVDGNQWWYCGTLADLIKRETGFTKGVMLPAGETSEEAGVVSGSVTCTVALHMQESAGNEYQNLSLGTVGFTLEAKQYTYEEDAFNDQYDLNAPWHSKTSNKPVSWVVGDDERVNYEIPTDDVTTVANSEELKKALNAKAATIVLEDGEYDWSGTGHIGTAQTVSIYGKSKNAVLKVNNEGGEGADNDFDGYTVTFTNLTVTSDNDWTTGWKRMNATYNDCVINNNMNLVNYNHVFNYCTLNQTENQYNIWTYGASVAEFNNCTFNCAGKSIYVDGNGSNKTVLKVNNCAFNDNGSIDEKAAIETGTTYGTTYDLIVNNTVVNGFAINPNGINTGSTLWGNKSSMGTDKLNVVVDGVDVY